MLIALLRSCGDVMDWKSYSQPHTETSLNFNIVRVSTNQLPYLIFYKFPAPTQNDATSLLFCCFCFCFCLLSRKVKWLENTLQCDHQESVIYICKTRHNKAQADTETLARLRRNLSKSLKKLLSQNSTLLAFPHEALHLPATSFRVRSSVT